MNQYFKKLTILSLMAISLVSCNSKQIKNEEIQKAHDNKKDVSLVIKDCMCVKMYLPVCADKKTYGNSCEAQCAGHKDYTMGACENQK